MKVDEDTSVRFIVPEVEIKEGRPMYNQEKIFRQRLFYTNLMNNIKSDKYQTGCLHIHGAFPYLLARPVQAGPDGFTTKYHNQYNNQ